MIWFRFIKTYFMLKRYESMKTFYSGVDASKPFAKRLLKQELLKLVAHHIDYVELKDTHGREYIGGTLTVMSTKK